MTTDHPESIRIETMPEYTDQQSWAAKSFRGYRTCTACDCDCGRVHFVSCPGHGDYEDGELERLQSQAISNPEKYVEHYDFDYVETCEIDRHSYVVDCPCRKLQKYTDWIEENADALAAYLRFHFEKRKDRLAELQKEAALLAAGIAEQ